MSSPVVKANPALNAKDAEKDWYRILGTPGVEFRYETRPTPTGLYQLIVRSTDDVTRVKQFGIRDINTCPIALYLQEAQIGFIRDFEETALKLRAERDARNRHAFQTRQERESEREAGRQECEQTDNGAPSDGAGEGCIERSPDSAPTSKRRLPTKPKAGRRKASPRN